MPPRDRRQVLATLAAVSAWPAAGAAPKVHVIIVNKMAFGAAPLGLRIGDAVEWVNRDIFRHSATARDGSFNLDLPPEGRARVVLRKAGAVSVYCRHHPNMTQVLKVGG